MRVYRPLDDWKVKIFFFYLTRPKLQRALSLVKWLLLLYCLAKAGLTLVKNFHSIVLDLSMCPVLPTASHSSGGSNSIVGVGSHEGSSSGWTSYDPYVYHPLLDDYTRHTELAARLRAHWWGIVYNDDILNRFVNKQLVIETNVEAALLEDNFSPQSVFEKRHQIRGFLFYPTGKALSEDAYDGHLKQILNSGTRQSVPYRRIIKAVRSSHLLLDRTDGLP